MKYYIICILLFASLLSAQDDILEGEREPIVVETRADLQNTLQLNPVNYDAPIEADSLERFNYTYHGMPIKTDYFLFAPKNSIAYLKVNGGNKSLFNLDLLYGDNNTNAKMDFGVYRNSDDREKNTGHMLVSHKDNNHKFAFELDYIESEFSGNLVSYDQFIGQVEYSYLYKNNKIIEIKLSNEYYDQSLNDASFINIFLASTMEIYSNLYYNMQLGYNHEKNRSSIELYYEDVNNIGLWFGKSRDDYLIAPKINIALSNNRWGFSLKNNPGFEFKSYHDIFNKNPYNIYILNDTDSALPVNADIKISYSNNLCLDVGNSFKYWVDRPIYRNGGDGLSFYNDTYWENSSYISVKKQINKLSLALKAEFISTGLSSDDTIKQDLNIAEVRLPFLAEERISADLNYSYQRLNCGFAVIHNFNMLDDSFNKIDNSTNMNMMADYQIVDWCSLWGQVDNLFKTDREEYSTLDKKDREYKIGVSMSF